MAQTIYATFITEHAAEKAAGALMDHGVPAADISFLVSHAPAQTDYAGGLVPTPAGPGTQATAPISAPAEVVPVASAPLTTSPVVAPVTPAPNVAVVPGVDPVTHEPVRTVASVAPADIPAIPANTPIDTIEGDRHPHIVDINRDLPHAASGITTTTAGDAAKGALEGAGIGLGLGILLGIATVAIPGIGLIAGAGAMAAGLAAATGAAGGVAGAVFGYLSDMGLPPEHAKRLSAHLEGGGAVLSVTPQGTISQSELTVLLEKYGATSAQVF